MGWNHDNGHEGYIAHLFAAGASGASASDRGATVTTDVNGRHLPAADWVDRPETEVVGWQLRCGCDSRKTWQGSTWTRVRTADQQDISARKLYADDNLDVLDIAVQDNDTDPVGAAMFDEWLRHADSQQALTELREAADAANTAARRLDAAAVQARRAGHSWDTVGTTAGITRQSAHERWAKLIKQPEPH